MAASGELLMYIQCFRSHVLLRYVRTSPTKLSVGDIVEARVSFLVASVSKGPGSSTTKEFRLVTVLRSLALIEDLFSKVCNVLNCANI
jgi:hypothetical protein